MRSLLAFHPLCRFLQCLEPPPSLVQVRLFASSVKPESFSHPESSSQYANTTRVRCRARVAYDGSNFLGFQVQQRSTNPLDGQRVRTVQGELEYFLSKRFCRYGNQGVRVTGAGRTDAGVHARGQAIHFDVAVSNDKVLDVLEDPKGLLRKEMLGNQNSIESSLPPDLALWNLEVAPDKTTKEIAGSMVDTEWSAMYESTLKWYSYRIHTGRTMHPLERHTRWHPDRVHTWFDEAQFRRLVEVFEGTHDFRAFATGMERLEDSKRQHVMEKILKAQEKNSLFAENGGVWEDLEDMSINTVRTVRSAKLIREKDCTYRIDFLLEGALYKQIRNMVGAVVDVCRGGFLTEEQFYHLLYTPTSRAKNPTKPAPPHGLTLEHVYFEAEESSF